MQQGQRPTNAQIAALLGLDRAGPGPSLAPINVSFPTPRFVPTGSLKPTPKSISGSIQATIANGLNRVGMNERRSNRLAARTMAPLTDATPVGNAIGMEEGGKQFLGGLSRGDLRAMGLGAGVFGLSAAPIPGGVKRTGKKLGTGLFGSMMKDKSGMFGGRRAANADLDARARAYEMEGNAASREAIWNDTGWFRGTDGRWRFEIDDSKAALKKIDEAALKSGQPLSKILRHAALADAYPAVANMPVRNRYDLASEGYAGNYQSGEIGLSPSYYNSRSKTQIAPLLGHETQHALQAAEGFARGGNAGEFAQWPAPLANDALVLRQFIEREGGADYFDQGLSQFTSVMGREPESIAQAVARQHDLETLREFANPKGAYRRLAGEVEARNVERRWKWAPERRRATPPWLTEDVIATDQIQRFR